MRFQLSKILPMPMRSTYTRNDIGQREHARWWQWRGRAYAVRTWPV